LLTSSTCSKPDRTSCSKSDERINADASWENQACCRLSFAGLMQLVSSTCIKSVDIKFQLSSLKRVQLSSLKLVLPRERHIYDWLTIAEKWIHWAISRLKLVFLNFF
jgi:hypothetical protein